MSVRGRHASPHHSHHPHLPPTQTHSPSPSQRSGESAYTDLSRFVTFAEHFKVELDDIPLLVYGETSVEKVEYTITHKNEMMQYEHDGSAPNGWKDFAYILSCFIRMKQNACFRWRYEEVVGGLDDITAETARDTPIALFIEGDVGIGKSTLLSQIASQAAPFIVVCGAGNPYEYVWLCVTFEGPVNASTYLTFPPSAPTIGTKAHRSFSRGNR